ncbi:maleylpyruvate isomerase family mycothiol-dependent enzyme [Micromonospora sp. NPDC050686]|uniref:maleylpyruvate isomerase family mycothiol-dependent enzyme n=1 Tax=Micromonospora sp. NPDC050686 TaxID=3154631 RepID=UPI0033EE4EF6
MTDVELPDARRRARDAMRRAAERFTALVRAAGDGTTRATRDWTVADTAAHLLSLAAYYGALLDPDAPRLPVPGLDRLLAGTTVDTVRDANEVVLRHLPERDPGRLADQLQAAVDRLLAATADVDARPVRWLGGALVTPTGLLAHLVNEFLVHGWDVARALAQPWPMPDADAALFLDEFLVEMIRRDYGALLDTGVRLPRRPIGVEFRSAHTRPALLILRNGRVHLGAAGDRPDARVTFRPARFNLMLFGRLSVPRALARRDVVVGGPRPWLVPAFLRVVHLPHN